MTLIIEDGTKMDLVSPVPNSYVTAAQISAHAALRGLTDIEDADTEELESAAIKAVDYLGQKYRELWKGSRVRAFQPLDWPRRGVDVPDFFDPFYKQTNVPISFQDTLFVAEDTVPQEVRDAQILLAISTFVGALSTGVLQANIGRATKREKLGELEVEYFNADDGSTRLTTIYWDAKKTLWPYLNPITPYGGRLTRS